MALLSANPSPLRIGIPTLYDVIKLLPIIIKKSIADKDSPAVWFDKIPVFSSKTEGHITSVSFAIIPIVCNIPKYSKIFPYLQQYFQLLYNNNTNMYTFRIVYKGNPKLNIPSEIIWSRQYHTKYVIDYMENSLEVDLALFKRSIYRLRSVDLPINYPTRLIKYLDKSVIDIPEKFKKLVTYGRNYMGKTQLYDKIVKNINGYLDIYLTHSINYGKYIPNLWFKSDYRVDVVSRHSEIEPNYLMISVNTWKNEYAKQTCFTISYHSSVNSYLVTFGHDLSNVSREEIAQKQVEPPHILRKCYLVAYHIMDQYMELKFNKHLLKFKKYMYYSCYNIIL